MEKLIKEITIGRDDLPLFSSCTSFEHPESEYILFTGEPKMVFEVVDDLEGKATESRFTRFVEHNNGQSDHLVLVDTFDPEWFSTKSEDEAVEHIQGVMDALEGWYVSEVIDLDTYDE